MRKINNETSKERQQTTDRNHKKNTDLPKNGSYLAHLHAQMKSVTNVLKFAQPERDIFRNHSLTVHEFLDFTFDSNMSSER